ncbi:MAG: tRNA (adenosine(37)-N6)-threonylcarbamoyltransferase complex ATPase subunit type 1 TsaE [Clostridia bacterium]|nr:tRNA (adenosine(37)-N6)-threonylcarbamoyltransferase complex ATPase subunit type 1 TsaE [Clostridia bacterium]
MKMKITTKTAEETMLIGEKLGKSVNPPCVISLAGDLGAGKTTFAKGFAKGLGVDEVVTSPTFTLLNEYASPRGGLYHFDLYRLTDVEEFRASGFEEYFDLTKLKGVVLVEWASNCPGILPARRFDVEIIKGDADIRTIEITPCGLV